MSAAKTAGVVTALLTSNARAGPRGPRGGFRRVSVVSGWNKMHQYVPLASMSGSRKPEPAVAPPPEALHSLILDSIREGVFTVDKDFRVTSFNAEAERITGFSRRDAVGRKCYEVFRASICQSGCALRETIETGRPLRDVRVDALNANMLPVPIAVSTAVLRSGNRLLGGVEIFRDLSDIERLRSELKGQGSFENIVGASPAMKRLFQLLPDVAASDAPVLIEGPSGTGKELVASAIHNLSARRDKPFLRVNCGALPDTLLESELFGYLRGAFTDARRNKPGHFVLADGGSILLDEIGDVTPAFQLKLLRVLQEGEVQPLGGTRPVKVDVRVLAATNRNLAAMVAEGRFRQDLYYRLRVVPIALVPLRERREDIPLLVDHFVHLQALKTGKPIREVSPRAMAVLSAYDYPGNVRELQNLIDRAFVLCHGKRIELDHLAAEVLRPQESDQPDIALLAGRRRPSERAVLQAARPSAKEGASEDPVARKLREALAAHGWSRTETARGLGIGRNTLWRRMREHGLVPGKKPGRRGT
jgi:PAS domain S-box-containing protein